MSEQKGALVDGQMTPGGDFVDWDAQLGIPLRKAEEADAVAAESTIDPRALGPLHPLRIALELEANDPVVVPGAPVRKAEQPMEPLRKSELEPEVCTDAIDALNDLVKAQTCPRGKPMMGKRTPAQAHALQRLAERKTANVRRVAAGKKPVVEGKPVAPGTEGTPSTKRAAKEQLEEYRERKAQPGYKKRLRQERDIPQSAIESYRKKKGAKMTKDGLTPLQRKLAGDYDAKIVGPTDAKMTAKLPAVQGRMSAKAKIPAVQTEIPAVQGRMTGKAKIPAVQTEIPAVQGRMSAKARKGPKPEHPMSEAQRRWAFAAEEQGKLPKGKALEWSRRAKGKDLPMYRSERGLELDMRKGGVHAFRDYDPSKTNPLPDALLPEYLAAFIEEAYECEKREWEHRGHQPPMADQDMHDFWAGRVMTELVQTMRLNKDLFRAAKNITAKQIAAILRQRGIVKPETKEGTPTDRDSWVAMQARIDGDDVPVMEFSEVRRGQFEEPLDKAAPLVLAESGLGKAEDIVDDKVDPFAELSGLQKARVAQLPVVQQESWKASVRHDCPIHGMGDLTKTMNLANPHGHCICG